MTLAPLSSLGRRCSFQNTLHSSQRRYAIKQREGSAVRCGLPNCRSLAALGTTISRGGHKQKHGGDYDKKTPPSYRIRGKREWSIRHSSERSSPTTWVPSPSLTTWFTLIIFRTLSSRTT